MLACAGVLLAVGVVGAFAAAALFRYSPTKLARRLKTDLQSPFLQHLLAHQRDYRMLAMLMTLVGILGGGLLAYVGAGDWRWTIVTVHVAVCVLGCAVLPARVADARAESVVLLTTRFLRPLQLVLYYPLLRPLSAIANGILRILRISETQPTDPDEIADEILAAVSDTAQVGNLPEEERNWIENIVELKDRQAREVMTPRTDMVALAADMPLLEAVKKAIEAGYSRFPVYQEKIDVIVGLFYAKDALSLLCNGDKDRVKTIGQTTRKPLFVPESVGLVDLLRQFRDSKVQMAIVLDEYGGTAGLVSIEDVLEEIVGEISDEYDVDEETPIKIIEEGKVIEATGRARVDEVNECLDVDIPEGEDYDTVAGYVFSSLDRIPKIDETVQVNGLEIRILRADDRRISRMRLRLLNPEPTDSQV